MNLANALTLMRALLAPLLAYLLLEEAFAPAVGVLLLAGVSDALDGHVARRFNQTSRLGAFLDPFADKLLIFATVLPLACVGRLPGWLVLLILARDAVIVAGSLAYRMLTGKLEMAPTQLSKLNTFLQVGLVLWVVGNAAGWLGGEDLLPAAFLAVAAATAGSGIQYVWLWAVKALRWQRGVAS
jgi:Phosphatidylglycerophosphate synthase